MGFRRLRHRQVAESPVIALSVLLVAGALLNACTSLIPPSISTPLPAEFLPTAAALTLAARDPQPSATLNLNQATSVSNTVETLPAPPAMPVSQEPVTKPEDIATLTGGAPTNSPFPPTPTASATIITAQPEPDSSEVTNTPAPPIPDARIQIYRLGDLSKVVSPLEVSSRLTSGEGRVVRIELFGEDGRLLARYVRRFDNVPWKSARVGVTLDFEINTAAELGRLVISAEDSFGRQIEANSVNLVLMSQGMTELNPPTALQQRLIIQEPTEMALIQNEWLITSGRAKPASSQPLRVMLIAEDGRVLGQRLAGISAAIPGDYGVFVAEVPYTVTEVTPALLVVFEEGGTISPLTYLTSIPVILAPQ